MYITAELWVTMRGCWTDIIRHDRVSKNNNYDTINLIVYCSPSTQLYEFVSINCLLKLKIATRFETLCGNHQVNTDTYMCIFNCKCLPNILVHIYNYIGPASTLYVVIIRWIEILICVFSIANVCLIYGSVFTIMWAQFRPSMWSSSGEYRYLHVYFQLQTFA
jgi:hypothetical protein